jgi:hypothetical protein
MRTNAKWSYFKTYATVGWIGNRLHTVVFTGYSLACRVKINLGLSKQFKNFFCGVDGNFMFIREKRFYLIIYFSVGFLLKGGACQLAALQFAVTFRW